MPFRKNVFILGAGFSADAGAPMMADFFDQAMNLWKDSGSPLDPAEREVFSRVFNYRHNLALAEANVRVNLDNIEDLFGAVEMESQLGSSDAAQIARDLTHVILRTLELKTLNAPGGGISFLYGTENQRREGTLQDGLYQFFVNLVARRWFPRPSEGLCTDSIISLNYDLLLERAAEEKGLVPHYDLGPLLVRDARANVSGACRLRILKLHGSANWAICSTCKDLVYVLTVPEASVHSSVAPTSCQQCGKPAAARLLVPPTWNKEEYRHLLSFVWQSAARELESAQRILVIGYSMPETDKFFQYLLAVSLSKNKMLDEIVVVNPDNLTNQRIAHLFRRLEERNRVNQFVSRFSEWVYRRDLQNSLKQTFPGDQPAW